MTPISHRAIALAMTMTSFACKSKTSESGIESLDSFAAQATLRWNACSASGQVENVPLANRLLVVGPSANLLDEPLKSQARISLTAVPVAYQRAFQAMDGHILITDAATDICVGSFQKDRVDEKDLAAVGGCVFFAPKGPRHAQVLKLVLPTDRRDVSHGTVFLMGSFMGQVVPKLFPEQEKAIVALKRDIALSYFEDLKASKDYDMRSVERFVGKDDKVNVQKALADGRVNDELFAKLTFDSAPSAQRQARLDQLLDMIFVHTFDSYYCRSHGTGAENTRQVLRTAFPRVYKTFTAGEGALLRAASVVNAKRGLGLASESVVEADLPADVPADASVNGFGLVDYSSPWSAFWSTLSDNTGYTSYTNAVTRAGSAIPAGSGNVVTNTASVLASGVDQSTGYDNYRGAVERGASGASSPAEAFAGGLKNGYVEQVYTPQYDQTTRDYAMAQKYGSTSPGYDAVAISMGRHVGTTPAVEAGAGWDLGKDRALNGEERILKGAEATSKLAGNGAMVAGMMPSLRYMPITNPLASAAEGRAAYTTVGLPVAADAETMAAVQRAGIPAEYAPGTAATFGEGTQMRVVGPEGKTVYRYHGGDPAVGGSKEIGRWVSDTPIANPREGFALPGANPADKVSELVMKPGTVYLEGPASSQVSNPAKAASGGELFGPHATGGANQIMVVGSESSLANTFGRSGYTPLLTVGGATTAQATPEGPVFNPNAGTSPVSKSPDFEPADSGSYDEQVQPEPEIDYSEQVPQAQQEPEPDAFESGP